MRGSALAIAVLGAGCREPGPLTEASSESSSGGETTSSGPAPGRVPPEPFVLPEGCGDGIVVPGQYDCHYPVSLEYLKEAMGANQDPSTFMVWDMDGDSRDELLARASTPELIAPLRWNGETFDVGKSASGRVSPVYWTTRFDIEADGQPDLVKFSNFDISYHSRTSTFEVEDETIPAVFDVSIVGQVGPLGVGSDAQLEVLAVRDPYTDENPFPPLELWQHRNVGGIWSPVGQALDLPGCHWPAEFAWADLDGDGHEDVAVLNHPSACDPFPVEYDPWWHSISIFFKEPRTQTLVPGPVVPAGGMTSGELLIVEDFDGDGHLDFLVGLGQAVGQNTIGAALVRGHGDGSFDEGMPIELPGILKWELKGRGDLDGDGDLDWILKGDAVVDDIFAAEPEIVHVHSDVIGVDGEPWAYPLAFGDFNDDGVLDYVGGWRVNREVYQRVAMISAP